MRYLIFLRGINVGGNNKVNMKALKAQFIAAGLANPLSYINSGNLIVSTDLMKEETQRLI